MGGAIKNLLFGGKIQRDTLKEKSGLTKTRKPESNNIGM